ncbi:hypothetical protein PMS82_11740, partial [Bifidobacterium longum]|nr:hypothetical protein [Bifidobacterium longum]
MGTHRPPVVMPDMKRRRASTGERIATIMTLARRLPCFASMFVRQVRQCFSAVWADGFPRCR